MTIRDAVLAYPGLSDMEDYLEKVVLPDRDLSGDEDISSVDSSVKKLLAADLYAVAGGNPDFTENKLTISYPRSWYETMAKRLYAEGGEPEKAESIGFQVPMGRAGERW